MAGCRCGLTPAKRTVDMAKSHICSGQFRSSEELEDMARLIRAGTPIPYSEHELSVAASIGTWNTVVNLGAVVAAALGVLFVVGIIAGLPIMATVTLGSAFVVVCVVVYILMKTVDYRIEQARPTPFGTGCSNRIIEEDRE